MQGRVVGDTQDPSGGCTIGQVHLDTLEVKLVLRSKNLQALNFDIGLSCANIIDHLLRWPLEMGEL